MAVVLGFELLAFALVQLHFDQGVRSALQQWQVANPLDDLSHPFAKSGDGRIRKALASGPLVIPFRYGVSGEMLIPINVDGQKQEFVFDTGASHLVIFKTVAPRFEPLAMPDHPSRPGAASLLGVFTASRFGLAQCHFENVHLGVLDYGAQGKYQPGVAGLFGGAVLENFCVTIDYDGRKIILAAPNAVSDTGSLTDSIVVPLDQRGNLSYLPVRLNGHRMEACLDTGAIDDSIYESELAGLTKPVQFDSGPVWCGPGFGMQKLISTQLDTLEVGSYNEKLPIFDVMDGETPHWMKGCLISNDFCSQFKQVTLDYLNKRVIFAHPHRASGLHLASEGRYWLIQNRPEQALTYFTKAEELEPQLLQRCDAARGYAQLCLGNYAQAIALLNGVITADPTSVSLHSARANAYEGLGEHAKAIDDLTAAIDLRPDDAESYVARARIADCVGHFRQAIVDCDRAIELDPQQSTAFVQRAWCYEKLGDHNRAIELFSKYVKSHPKDPQGYENRAWCYMEIERNDLAVADCDEALKLNPKLSRTRHIRARSLVHLRKSSQSL